MMTKLREFSKIFVIILAVSFIGLMVFEWGMDYTGQSKKNNVGTVNDHELSYTAFSEMYQQVYQEQRARSNKTEFSEEELQVVRDQVWERFIQQTLFNEEMEKLGISVSDSEIVYQIYNYPLEDFKQHPSFQTDGIFDINKYHAAFNNPNIPWRQVEQIYREQIPFIKLQNIITSTALISEKEILDDFVKNNQKAKVEYLSVPARRFDSKDISVSEKEIETYYNENKEDYKKNEKRQLAYVLFEIKTTDADSSHLFREFEHIRQRLEGGEDFNALAKEYSEDPSVSTNSGDLGYFEHGSMVKPFSDAAFGAKVGQVVGPVETSFGFHLIKIEDKKTENGTKQVKASHILMKITPAPSRIADIESAARYFSEDAKDAGFTIQAEANKYEIKTTNPFEESSSFIPGIGNNLAVKNFAFSSDLNDVSGLYRLDQGYAIFSLQNIDPAGYREIETEKRSIENRVKLEKAKVKAREFADKFNDAVQAGTDFKSIAANDTSKIMRSTTSSLFSINGTVSGIGTNTDFNATAFALEPNQTSGLIETDRAFYYLKLIEKTAFDSTAFVAQKESSRSRLLNQKRNLIFQKWYDQLKEDADIVDNRKMFGL